RAAAELRSPNVDHGERERIEEVARAAIHVREHLARRTLPERSRRRKAYLQLPNRFARTLADRSRIGKPRVGVELRPRERAGVLGRRHVEHEPLELEARSAGTQSGAPVAVRQRLTRVAPIVVARGAPDVALIPRTAERTAKHAGVAATVVAAEPRPRLQRERSRRRWRRPNVDHASGGVSVECRRRATNR